MEYTKEDATMTKGLAILSMVILHLFCRTGDDVLGKPIIWVTETVPLVYYFGFFSEICVPLYSISVGYAQKLLCERNRNGPKAKAHRIGKLLVNYWIVLAVFCVLGLLFDRRGEIPGSFVNLIQSIFLLHIYNGSWWYLKTYFILLLIPSRVLLAPIKKVSAKKGFIGCIAFQIAWYCLDRLHLLPSFEGGILSTVWTEIYNLIGVLPYVWLGALICRDNLVVRARRACAEICPAFEKQNTILLLAGLALFVLVSVLHKAVFVGISTLLTFFIFNLLHKSERVKKVFLFLGKHSTNIWLTHMFFYAYIFTGLVQLSKYPLFMLAFMLLLCIGTSYLIIAIHTGLDRMTGWVHTKYHTIYGR